MAEKKPPKNDPPKKKATRASRSPRAAKSTSAPEKKPRAPRKKKVHAVAGAAPAMPSLPSIPRADLDRLLAGEHSSPHSILGAHPATLGGEAGIVVRALIPNAVYVECV